MALTRVASKSDNSMLAGMRSTPSLWCKIPSSAVKSSSRMIFPMTVARVVCKLSWSCQPRQVVRSPWGSASNEQNFFPPDAPGQCPGSPSWWFCLCRLSGWPARSRGYPWAASLFRHFHVLLLHRFSRPLAGRTAMYAENPKDGHEKSRLLFLKRISGSLSSDM